MSALTIDAAHLTENSIGGIVLPKPGRTTRTSALAGYRVDMLQRGLTPATAVHVADFKAQAMTN